MKPYFSVVIPAWNEAAYLGNAIEALKHQDIGRDQFEIIVVDNGSDDETSAIASKSGADWVFSEPRRGTNIARETGFRKSAGEIVAFLDADCVPPPSWLRQISRALSKNGVVAVSGPYDYGFRGLTKLADKLYTHLLFARADRILKFVFRKPIGVVRAGNFAASRRTLETIGGLPPFTFWGDDTAIGMKIATEVGRVWYNPHLIVKSSPRRFEDHGLIRTTWRYLRHFFRVYLFDQTPQ